MQKIFQRNICLPLGLLSLLLTVGCVQDRYVPVFQAGEEQGSNVYVVRPGDTLYSIAFRYGIDYKELAAANEIRPPYTIFIDQRLRLMKLARSEEASEPVDQPVVSQNQTSESQTSPVSKPVMRVKDSNIEWHWPYDGPVVSRFSLSGKVNKGIDIKGKADDGVQVSADGVVVYAGGGLRGYGKLVIVKHNERYLSAYGHNKTLLVKEGDRVSRGQIVSRIGGPNGDKDLLHFEIRRDGKPQDPLAYLPPRP